MNRPAKGVLQSPRPCTTRVESGQVWSALTPGVNVTPGVKCYAHTLSSLGYPVVPRITTAQYVQQQQTLFAGLLRLLVIYQLRNIMNSNELARKKVISLLGEDLCDEDLDAVTERLRKSKVLEVLDLCSNCQYTSSLQR